jgi:hypothetical protein
MKIQPTGPALHYIVVDSIFIVLTTVVIALRLWVRLKNRKIGLDDWLMFIGFVSLIKRYPTVLPTSTKVSRMYYYLV